MGEFVRVCDVLVGRSSGCQTRWFTDGLATPTAFILSREA
jgi:hypothetical protein